MKKRSNWRPLYKRLPLIVFKVLRILLTNYFFIPLRSAIEFYLKAAEKRGSGDQIVLGFRSPFTPPLLSNVLPGFVFLSTRGTSTRAPVCLLSVCFRRKQIEIGLVIII